MKRMSTLGVAGVLCALLLGAGSSVGAAPSRTVELYVTAGEPTHVDELEPGLGAGDWLLSHDPVVDAGGEVVGTAVTRVQVIAPLDGDDLAFILDCTVELDDGRLVFSGAEQLSRLATSVAYAVVGGTGRYAGARGEVTGEPASIDGNPVTRLTFALARR